MRSRRRHCGHWAAAARRAEEKSWYVGGVGTGFSEYSAGEFRKQIDKLTIGKPPVDTDGSEMRSSSIRSLLPRSNIERGRTTGSCGTRHLRGCATLLITQAFMRCNNSPAPLRPVAANSRPRWAEIRPWSLNEVAVYNFFRSSCLGVIIRTKR